MINTSKRLPAATDLDSDPFASTESAQESPFLIFQRLHRLLRGRYWLACILAMLGAAAGAVGGYRATVPKYQSVGSIRILAALPVKLYPDANINQVPAMFQAYVKTQANLIQHPRVIDRAMASTAWRNLGRGSTPKEREKFLDSLKVTTDRDNPEWIYVKFLDADSRAAKIAVEEVILAYAEIWGREEMIITPELIADLNRMLTKQKSELAVVEGRSFEISSRWNTSDLATLQNHHLQEMTKLEQQVAALRMQISQAETELAAREGNPEQEDVRDPVTLASEIALSDLLVREDLARYTTARSQVALLEEQGLTERHPGLRRARQQAAAAHKQLQESVNNYIAQGGNLRLGTPLIGAVSQQALEAMKTNLQQMLADVERRTDIMQRLQRDAADMQSLQKELRTREEDLAMIKRRLAVLESESDSNDTTSNRIKIISRGEQPTAPWVDSRKKLAAMGVVFGGGLPIGIIMLLGLLDGRFRFSDEASDPKRHVTLLGILPYLPAQMQDPEQASIAAHCVHQIRTLLQIGSTMQNRSVFAVTSPTAGDGKTSLSLSLGLSFAATGANTCLIDFDMIGGGLTSGMQAKTDAGLMDAIDAGSIDDYVRPTSFPHLSIIPIGRDDARDVSRLSPASVRRIIEQAKERFDNVVIDTGPILGSIEASLACSAADGVILALGRGQQRFQADRAIEHLHSIGAHLMGIVFNRAQAGDFRRAVSSASVRSIPMLDKARGNGQSSRLRALPAAMGPMASTIASSIRSDDPEEAHAK